jgi:hypothetical protein
MFNLTEDDARDLAIRIIWKLIKNGIIRGCNDLDGLQDTIVETLMKGGE